MARIHILRDIAANNLDPNVKYNNVKDGKLAARNVTHSQQLKETVVSSETKEAVSAAPTVSDKKNQPKKEAEKTAEVVKTEEKKPEAKTTVKNSEVEKAEEKK